MSSASTGQPADRGEHQLCSALAGQVCNRLRPGVLALPGAALLRLAELLNLRALAELRAAARAELLERLARQLLRGSGPHAMDYWAVQLKDAVASISFGKPSAGGKLVLALESTPQARDSLEKLFGPGAAGSFRSDGALLLAEGPDAARLLLQLLGEPLEAYWLLREWTGQTKQRCHPGCVAFSAEGETVAWRHPEHHLGFSVVFGAYAYRGDGSALMLRVATSVDRAQEDGPPARGEGLEEFRRYWHERRSDADRVKILGSPFLPEVRCRCGLPVVTALELQRLQEDLPVCPGCESSALRWTQQAEAEEARRRAQKAKAKARQEQKVKQHHGSSSKPYSQKRR